MNADCENRSAPNVDGPCTVAIMPNVEHQVIALLSEDESAGLTLPQIQDRLPLVDAAVLVAMEQAGEIQSELIGMAEAVSPGNESRTIDRLNDTVYFLADGGSLSD